MSCTLDTPFKIHRKTIPRRFRKTRNGPSRPRKGARWLHWKLVVSLAVLREKHQLNDVIRQRGAGRRGQLTMITGGLGAVGAKLNTPNGNLDEKVTVRPEVL